MKYLSLFSGIGGFELGIEQAYKKEYKDNVPICVGFSEIDKYASSIYAKHFPTHTNLGDITKINEEELPDFDFLCGGFPCQSFSVAGKRGGFDDTRGTLFFEICRILKAKQPSLILLENVKGLLSHEEGRTFRTIITSLDELGYDCQWQVLNSKDFGVPQNRERVFIVGHLRGTPRPEVFPINKSQRELTGEANKLWCANTLTGRSAGGGNRRGNYIAGTLRTYKDGEGFRKSKSGCVPTIPARAREDGSGQPVVRQPLRFLTRNQKNIDGDYSFTVDTSNTGGVRVGDEIRRLTPMECERLQGFPDNWTQSVSDSQRYKMCGNAVTVNVIQEIMSHLL